MSMLSQLFNLKNVPPKRSKKRGECQSVIYEGANASLDRLPILTTWSEDGGPFITMGQVYTQSLDGKMQNLGMYRLQKYDESHLGLHWQIHKDSSCFFDQYREAGKKCLFPSLLEVIPSTFGADKRPCLMVCLS